jgi:hypothetical protein
VAPELSGVSPILPAVSDFAVPLPIPDVATAIEEAHADRHAAGQRLFQFLIDVDDVDLREEAVQARLFDSDARDATLLSSLTCTVWPSPAPPRALPMPSAVRWQTLSGDFLTLLSSLSPSSRQSITRLD